MADRSHVTSIDAIEAFRAHLIVYLSKARPAVEEVSGEILRLRYWLENDQRNHWNAEIRQLNRQLERAQQELFAAKLSKLQNASAVQEMAVQRLKRDLREAESRQAATKKWSRELENRTEPLVKEVEALHTFLTFDLPRAVAYLELVVKALEAYADVPSPGLPAGEHPPPAVVGGSDAKGEPA